MYKLTEGKGKQLLLLLLGPALMAASLDIFVIPNDFAPGGVSGLATALAATLPVSVGVLSLALNVPLFIGAWRVLGWRPLIRTAVPTVLLSVCIDAFSLFLPSYGNNLLLAAILGGAGSGIGMGMLFACGASSGGTDLLTLIVSRRLPDLPLGGLLMAIDAAVVVFAVCIFRNIDVALYSGVTIFVCSKVIDNFLSGVDFAKVIYIVTEKGEEISSVLNREIDRGVTILPARGGYTGQEKQVLMTVTRRSELSQTLRLVKMTDPAAFLFVMNSTEVHGEGFKSMEA